MPEAPKPSPTFDRSVSRNLFVEADPDLDALIESTADSPAQTWRAAARSRPRGPRRAAPIASRQASARCRALRPRERQRRSAAGRGAARAPADRRGCRTAAARPGGQAVPRAGGDRCAGGAVGRVQLAGARPPRHSRSPRGGRRAAGSHRGRVQVRGGEDRGAECRAAPARAERAANRGEHGAHRADGRPSPAGRAQAADRPPTTPSSLIRHVATATAITRGDARPRHAGRERDHRSPPRGKHPGQRTNRRAAKRADARPAGTRRATRPAIAGRSVRSTVIPTRPTGRWLSSG